MQQAMISGATMWWKKMLEKREEIFWKEGDDEEAIKIEEIFWKEGDDEEAIKIEEKKETKDEKILK